MASSLRHTIQQLTHSFASSILAAIRAASIEEILEETGRAGRRGPPDHAQKKSRAKGGRLVRRSAKDIADLVDRIVELLAEHPEGLRAERIRNELELEAKELPRPLSDGLADRRITKSGQKRATTYFAARGQVPSSRKGGAARGRKGKGRGKAGPPEPASTNGAPAAS